MRRSRVLRGRFVGYRGSSDACVSSRCSRSLSAVGEDGQSRYGRGSWRDWPRALRDGPAARPAVCALRERRQSEIARRIGDPRTLAYALDGRSAPFEGPGDLRRSATPSPDELIVTRRATSATSERASSATRARFHSTTGPSRDPQPQDEGDGIPAAAWPTSCAARPACGISPSTQRGCRGDRCDGRFDAAHELISRAH